jgi:succinate-acetate transporter protein
MGILQTIRLCFPETIVATRLSNLFAEDLYAHTLSKEKVQLKERMIMTEKLANPAPLGLMGFGITTVLLNLHNAGFYPLGSMILAMGLVYGGLAQVITGIMEYKKGNTFGTLAFTSYGLFWWSLVLLLVLPQSTLIFPPFEAAGDTAMAAYFFIWGLFTLMLFFGTLKTNRAIQFVFMSLAVLFFLLTLGRLTQNETILLITGYEGIICGASAIYTALAETLNEVYDRTILPLCPAKK